MQGQNRRVFMLHAVAGTTALTIPAVVVAQATSGPVKESDPYPKSMGFKLNTADVDKVKFPRHEASQKCSACQLYAEPTGGEKLGVCSFFKRQVPTEGWCRNYKPIKAA